MQKKKGDNSTVYIISGEKHDATLLAAFVSLRFDDQGVSR